MWVFFLCCDPFPFSLSGSKVIVCVELSSGHPPTAHHISPSFINIRCNRAVPAAHLHTRKEKKCMNVIILEIDGDVFIIPARECSEVVIRVLEPATKIEPTYHLLRVTGTDGWMGGVIL